MIEYAKAQEIGREVERILNLAAQRAIVLGFAPDEILIVYHDNEAAAPKDWGIGSTLCIRKIPVFRVTLGMRESPLDIPSHAAPKVTITGAFVNGGSRFEHLIGDPPSTPIIKPPPTLKLIPGGA